VGAGSGVSRKRKSAVIGHSLVEQHRGQRVETKPHRVGLEHRVDRAERHSEIDRARFEGQRQRAHERSDGSGLVERGRHAHHGRRRHHHQPKEGLRQRGAERGRRGDATATTTSCGSGRSSLQGPEVGLAHRFRHRFASGSARFFAQYKHERLLQSEIFGGRRQQDGRRQRERRRAKRVAGEVRGATPAPQARSPTATSDLQRERGGIRQRERLHRDGLQLSGRGLQAAQKVPQKHQRQQHGRLPKLNSDRSLFAAAPSDEKREADNKPPREPTGRATSVPCTTATPIRQLLFRGFFTLGFDAQQSHDNHLDRGMQAQRDPGQPHPGRKSGREVLRPPALHDDFYNDFCSCFDSNDVQLRQLPATTAAAGQLQQQ
jgi:hypothetical protein